MSQYKINAFIIIHNKQREKITDISDKVQFKHQVFSQKLSFPNFCISESVLFPASKIKSRKFLLTVTSMGSTGSARIQFQFYCENLSIQKHKIWKMILGFFFVCVETLFI